MHTSFAGFESRAAALAGNVAKSRYHLSLDGPVAGAYVPQSRGTAGRLRGPSPRRVDLARSGGTGHPPGTGVEPPDLRGSGYPFPRNEPFYRASAERGPPPIAATSPSPAHFAGRRLLLNIGAAARPIISGSMARRSAIPRTPSSPTNSTSAVRPSRARTSSRSNSIAMPTAATGGSGFLAGQRDRADDHPLCRAADAYPRSGIDAGLTHDYRDGTLSAAIDLAGAAEATTVRATLLDGKRTVLTRTATPTGTARTITAEVPA